MCQNSHSLPRLYKLSYLRTLTDTYSNWLAHEKLGALLFRILGRRDCMSNGSLMGENFEIVPPFKRLVTEKMNLIIVRRINEFETIGLVPSGRKHIETNLSSNAVGEIQIGKLFAHCDHHGFSDLVLQIVGFVIVAFFATAVATNGRNVEHATAEFEKSTALLE